MAAPHEVYTERTAEPAQQNSIRLHLQSSYHLLHEPESVECSMVTLGFLLFLIYTYSLGDISGVMACNAIYVLKALKCIFLVQTYSPEFQA